MSNLLYFSIIFAVQLGVITIYGRKLSYTISWCNDFNENMAMPYVVGMLGIAFWLRVAKILEPLLADSKCIRLISNHTYSIMVNQFLGFMIVKTIFALIAWFTPFCANFDFAEYKSNIWWYYIPKGIPNWYILYMIGGIVIPITISLLQERLTCLIRQRKKMVLQRVFK